MDAGKKFIGNEYTEIGNGVFRSNKPDANVFFRQFRIDRGSISGAHAPNVPHGHLEMYKVGANKPFVNNHIPFFD